MDKDRLKSDEMAQVVSVLAEEYNTTIPTIIHKLDLVSGDLHALHRLMSGDKNVEWNAQEDEILIKNPEVMKRWKGQDATELRKNYIAHKVK